MDGLISFALAQAPAGPSPVSSYQTIFFLVVMMVVFYFLLIRPQSKRAQEHRTLIASMEKGAEVVTAGGILGKVTELGEQYVTVEIGDGVRVKVQRHTITQILPTGTLKSV